MSRTHCPYLSQSGRLPKGVQGKTPLLVPLPLLRIEERRKLVLSWGDL